jgi:hypothetical protein
MVATDLHRRLESPRKQETGDSDEDTCVWLCQPSMRLGGARRTDPIESTAVVNGRADEPYQSNCWVRSDEPAHIDRDPARADPVLASLRSDVQHVVTDDIQLALGVNRARHEQQPFNELADDEQQPADP